MHLTIARIFYRGEVVAYRLQNKQGQILDCTSEEFYNAVKSGYVIITVAIDGLNSFKDKLFGAVPVRVFNRFGTDFYRLAITSNSIYIQKIQIADKNTRTNGKPLVLKPDFYGFHSLINIIDCCNEISSILEYDSRLMMAYEPTAPNGESVHIGGVLMGFSYADEILAIARQNLASDPVWGGTSKSNDEIKAEAMQRSREIIDEIFAEEEVSRSGYASRLIIQETSPKKIEQAQRPIKPKDISKSKGLAGIFKFLIGHKITKQGHKRDI